MFRAVIFLLFFAPFTLLMSFFAIAGALFDKTGNLSHACALLWGKGGLWLAGIQVEVSGQEHIPHDQSVIFMGNHQSNFDILALFGAIPRRFSWLAKEELFRVPLFGKAMLRAGYIPVDRGDGRSALKSLDEAASRIRNGVNVVIFPEGTRTFDGKLLPFKRGGFILAAKAVVPIIPFTINGSMKINPRNQLRLYPGRIHIRFMEPVSTADARGAGRELLAERVRCSIESGLEAYT